MKALKTLSLIEERDLIKKLLTFERMRKSLRVQLEDELYKLNQKIKKL